MLRSLYLFSAMEEKFRSLGMAARRVRGMNKSTFFTNILSTVIGFHLN